MVRISGFGAMIAVWAVQGAEAAAPAGTPRPVITPPVSAAPPAPRDWPVRFPMGGVMLRPSARAAVLAAAAYAGAAYSGRATVVAYADSPRLAARRARVLLEALEAAGVDRAKLAPSPRWGPGFERRRTVIRVRFRPGG